MTTEPWEPSAEPEPVPDSGSSESTLASLLVRGAVLHMAVGAGTMAWDWWRQQRRRAAAAVRRP